MSTLNSDRHRANSREILEAAGINSQAELVPGVVIKTENRTYTITSSNTHALDSVRYVEYTIDNYDGTPRATGRTNGRTTASNMYNRKIVSALK